MEGGAIPDIGSGYKRIKGGTYEKIQMPFHEQA